LILPGESPKALIFRLFSPTSGPKPGASPASLLSPPLPACVCLQAGLELMASTYFFLAFFLVAFFFAAFFFAFFLAITLTPIVSVERKYKQHLHLNNNTKLQLEVYYSSVFQFF
jgi:hypothetical protein